MLDAQKMLYDCISIGIVSNQFSLSLYLSLQLTNRKSLAFTSKTPGKTQQFNYFAVNDKPDLERQIRYGDDVGGSKDRDSFYIVDLPGE